MGVALGATDYLAKPIDREQPRGTAPPPVGADAPREPRQPRGLGVGERWARRPIAQAGLRASQKCMGVKIFSLPPSCMPFFSASISLS